MYSESNPKLWKGRVDSQNDPKQFKHFQTVTFANLEKIENRFDKVGVGLLGYAVDKGIELNEGRIGAKKGPDEIKKAFDLSECESLVDYGNVEYTKGSLSEVQEEMGHLAARVIQQHHQSFFIGGGHDITYAQYLAKRHTYPDASIGIINIDSHFETRADVQSNSGTMFRQILEKDDNVDYLVLGLSQGRNTRSLYEYAEEKGIIYVYADEHETIMFTISMDAIDSAFAPGVSEPTVLGLNPHSVFNIGKRVILSGKTSSISIAEVNPNYDIDHRTAQLAANFIHHFIE